MSPGIEQEVRGFISAELVVDEDAPLEDDSELLLDGTIDSLGAMRLVAFIEQRWDIDIPPQDLTVDNFGSIGQMAGYVRGRLSPESS